jgi:dephospho-CoA kinase
MIVIGLTGSIAMGKSETARMFRAEAIPVFDADAVVADLYAKNGAAVAGIAAHFPDAIVDGAVDRTRLSRLLAVSPAAFKVLEDIVHPLVRAAEAEFLEACRTRGEPLAVLDIPLLFETGRDKEVDKVVVVSAPPEIQRQRALARPGMTEEKLAMIMARQIPDSEKRKRADFVVDSSEGLDVAHDRVRRIIAALKEQEGHSHA